MSEIDECRQAVMAAYLWLARMKSTDPVMMDKIRTLQIHMEEVWTGFQVVFP